MLLLTSPDTFLCLLLLWGGVCAHLSKIGQFSSDFAGVQCPTSDRLGSLPFPNFIPGAPGALPPLANGKWLGSSPVFFLPYSLFALSVTSLGFERLWYFERNPHPLKSYGLAMCPVFDKMHFFSSDEKLKVLTFWALNVATLFSFPSWATSSFSVITLLVWCALAPKWTKSLNLKWWYLFLTALCLSHQCQAPVDAQRAGAILSICVPVGEPSCPEHFVTKADFATEVYHLLGLYQCPGCRVLLSLEEVYSVFWTQEIWDCFFLSQFLPLFPSFFFNMSTKMCNKTIQYLVTRWLWLFVLSHPLCFLGLSATSLEMHWGGRGGELFQARGTNGSWCPGLGRMWSQLAQRQPVWAGRKVSVELGCAGWQPGSFGCPGLGSLLQGAYLHLHRGWRWLFFPFKPNLGVNSMGWNFALRHTIQPKFVLAVSQLLCLAISITIFNCCFVIWLWL